MKRKSIIIIQGFMAVLAVFSAGVAVAYGFFGAQNLEFYQVFLWSTSIVYFAYYIVRLIVVPDKKKFISNHITDIMSFLPMLWISSIFRLSYVLRFMIIVHFRRSETMIESFLKAKEKVREFMRTNGFINALYIFVAFMAISAALIYYVEKDYGISSYEHALWWTIVTASTVGYGDMYPLTQTGRVIASIVIVFGVGFMSILTGTIATYFSKRGNATKATDDEQVLLSYAKKLSPEQLELIIKIAQAQSQGLDLSIQVVQPKNEVKVD